VLPRLAQLSPTGLDAFVAQCRAHDRAGDDRLAYVAVTRARDLVLASGHWWGPTQKTMRGPSPYLLALRAEAEAAGAAAGSAGMAVAGASNAGAAGAQSPARRARAHRDAPGPTSRTPPGDGPAHAPPFDPWVQQPEPDERGEAPTNPLLGTVAEVDWPARVPDRPELLHAAAAVGAVVDAGSQGVDSGSFPAPGSATSEVLEQIAAWDEAVAALRVRTLAPAAGPVVQVPAVLSASSAMELAADPEAFAARLLRPMPRRRNRHAELGVAFHAWVEARLGVQPLLTDEELPGAADEGIHSAAELERLKVAFEALPHAARSPWGLEVPFSLPVGGRLLRGRIDAVFRAGPGAPDGILWEVVDWKTSTREEADPLQLAIYRLAWADLAGVPVEAVDAAFVFVPTQTVRRPDALPGRDQLAELLGPGAVGASPTRDEGSVRGPGTRRRARSGR